MRASSSWWSSSTGGATSLQLTLSPLASADGSSVVAAASFASTATLGSSAASTAASTVASAAGVASLASVTTAAAVVSAVVAVVAVTVAAAVVAVAVAVAVARFGDMFPVECELPAVESAMGLFVYCIRPSTRPPATLLPLLNIPVNADKALLLLKLLAAPPPPLPPPPLLPLPPVAALPTDDASVVKSSGDSAGTAHLHVEYFGPSTLPLHRRHVSRIVEGNRPLPLGLPLLKLPRPSSPASSAMIDGAKNDAIAADDAPSAAVVDAAAAAADDDDEASTTVAGVAAVDAAACDELLLLLPTTLPNILESSEAPPRYALLVDVASLPTL